MKMLFYCIFLMTLHGGLAYGGFEMMNRLHQDLFAQYNPEVRPCLHYNQSIDVVTSLVVTSVMGLDIKDQVLKLIGYLSFKWNDDQLSWNPDMYEGIKRIFVKEDKIWRPDIVVTNSITEKVYVGEENVIVYITYSGTVVWEPAINLGVTCKVDISNYPFDVNICGVIVASWNYPETAVNLVTDSMPIRLINMMENGQYWIDPGNVTIFKLHHIGEVYKTITFQLRLTRRPGYLIMTLLLPLTLLAVLCVVSFMLSPEVSEKTPLAITVLLSFTVYLNVVDKELPETSDHLAHMVKFVAMLLFLSFFCVIGNAIVIVIHKGDLKNVVSFAREDEPLVKKEVSDNQPITRLNDLGVEDKNSIVVEQTSAANQRKRMPRAEKLNHCFLVVNLLALVLTVISYFATVLM